MSDDYKKALYGYSRQKSGGGNGTGGPGDIYWSRREGGNGPMTENEYASIQDGFPPVSPTGSAMPEVDFSHHHGVSSFPPPPYRGGEQHPGHFQTGTGSRQKRHQNDVSPPRLQGLSQSTGSLDTEAREYFVLDPEESRGHRMINMSER